VRIIEPGSNLFKAVEMEKNQRHFVHAYPFGLTRDGIPGNIPRSQIRSLMSDDAKARKKARPEIQIFLIRITVSFHSIIAPFQTPFAPPFKAFMPVIVVSEGEPTDVEPAVFEPMPEIRGIPMFHEGNGASSDFIKNRSRVMVEKKIRVQVGHHGSFGPMA
jgi:hypothetical protein